MATLTIRNLPQDVHDRLRQQAAEHRRSMEAEARAVLSAGLEFKSGADDRVAALAELYEMGRQWRAQSTAPEGWSFVDQDVAERQLEGAWEDGRVTDEERLSWLERMNSFETTPAELQAFVASRTP